MKTQIILVLSCLTLQVFSAKSKYNEDGEDNPYEFGFTIDGQQHRHEKKDSNGIIQGEFGFITADGIYHVTVYATDENGNFKILSMRNVRVSGPLDEPNAKLPDTSQFGKRNPNPAPNPLAIAPPAPAPISAVQTTQRPQVQFTTQATIKPACAGCGYVTTPKNDGKLPFQTQAFQNPKPGTVVIGNKPGSSQNDSPFNAGNLPSQQGGLGLPSTIPQIPSQPGENSFPSVLPQIPSQQAGHGISSKFPQIPPQQGENGLPSKFPQIPSHQGGNILPSKFPQIPSQQGGNGSPSKFPQIPSQQGGIGLPSKFPQTPSQQGGNGLPSTFPQISSQQGGNGLPSTFPQIPSQQGANDLPSAFPQNPSQQGGYGLPSKFPQNPSQAGGNSFLPNPQQNNPTFPQTNKPGIISQTPIANPLGIGNDNNVDTPPSGITVDNNVIKIPNNDPIPIKDKYPGMVDGLPAGITKDDITDLLYKFNYTVGFHGHYEKGYKNGAKVGGYFVNDRDGVSRIVTYVADENGYRPKVKFIRLDLNSDLVPKEGSEKKFGLKNFEFVWYPLK